MAKPGANGQTPVSCDVCGKTLKDRSGLSGHRQFAHRISPRSTSDATVVLDAAGASKAKDFTQASSIDSQNKQPGPAEQSIAINELLERLQERVSIAERDLGDQYDSADIRWSVHQEQMRHLNEVVAAIAVLATDNCQVAETGSSEYLWRNINVIQSALERVEQWLTDDPWTIDEAAAVAEDDAAAPTGTNIEASDAKLQQPVPTPGTSGLVRIHIVRGDSQQQLK